MTVLSLQLVVLVLLAAWQQSQGAGGITSTFLRTPATSFLPITHPDLAAVAEVEQVHISLLGPDKISVNWVSPRYASQPLSRGTLDAKQLKLQQQACTTESVQSIVEYGTQPGRYASQAQGSYTCYSVGEYDSGLLHAVVVAPLQPSTTYYYRCGDPTRSMSGEFSFTTPPSTGSDNIFPLRLGLLGDIGQTVHSQTTMQHMISSKPGVVVNVGDLSYADGFQPRWDSWGRMIEPLYASVPMLVTEGNHEIEDYSLATPLPNSLRIDPSFVAYETRFFVPDYQGYQNGSPSPLFYSRNIAGAHIIMLGSYAAYKEGSEQYEWLLSDLASVDRSITPWVFVAMHAPWYNSNTAHQGEADAMRDAMEDIVFQYGVDAVFAGHVHAYERTARVYKQRPDPCAPHYVIIGDGGNREGLAGDWQYPQPSWSLFRESSYGHGTIDLFNSTHALFRWMRNDDVDTPTAADEFWIVRNSACSVPTGVEGLQQIHTMQQLPVSEQGATIPAAEQAKKRKQHALGLDAAHTDSSEQGRMLRIAHAAKIIKDKKSRKILPGAVLKHIEETL